MAKEVYMPALGMAQTTGTLLRWLKAEGERVRKGEPLMEVATDKSDVEIEASASGILRNVTAREGDEVPVGQTMALIAGENETVPPVASPPAPSTPTPAAPAPAASPVSVSPAVSPVAARMAAEHGVDVSQIKPSGGRVQKEDVLAYLAAQQANQPPISPVQPGNGRTPASPLARRLAQEAELDITLLQGSGPEGAVIAADVQTALAQQLLTPTVQPVLTSTSTPTVAQPLPVAGEEVTIPMSRMWKVMADRLTQSWTTVPHFFLTREVDATRLIAWRTTMQGQVEAKLTYTDLLVKLVAAALQAHPRVNAAWINGKIVANANVHVGIAVAVEDGLLVPVIRDADTLGLNALAMRRADLVARGQSGQLGIDDLQDGTFTMSNLGMFGVDQFNAIINPPQAGILAIGRMVDKVVAVNGAPAVRPMMSFTLSCDHRVVDGARAARFLDYLAGLVEEPLRLLA